MSSWWSAASVANALGLKGPITERRALIPEFKRSISIFFAFDLAWHFGVGRMIAPSAVVGPRTTRQTAILFAVWSVLGYGAANTERWAAESWTRDRALLLHWWERQRQTQNPDAEMPPLLRNGGKDARGRSREDRYLAAYVTGITGLGGASVLLSYKPGLRVVLGRPGTITANFILGVLGLGVGGAVVRLGAFERERRRLEKRLDGN